jgi:3-isopropylmalate dehydrogenase
MATHKIFLLPGDGIGPEVMTEVEKVAAFMGQAGLASFEFERGLVGGAAYDAHGASISEEHMALAQAADAGWLAWEGTLLESPDAPDGDCVLYGAFAAAAGAARLAVEG